MLEVSAMSVSYGATRALTDVSLKVERGSVVSLIGSNGAGKTTTLKAIIGLIRNQRGEIRLDGKRIDQLPAPERVGLGVTLSPEGRRVFPQMSVLDNLLVGAYLRKDKAKIEADLEQIFRYFPRLLERRGQSAGSLSGGEQQMLAIGRALMAKPQFLLLDEPSLGLAPIIVDEIERIIREINSDLGVAIVLVEQNANLALRLSDHAYVLETGAISLEGSGAELLSSDYVRRAYLGV